MENRMGYKRTLGKSVDGLGIIVNHFLSHSLIKNLLFSSDPHSSLMVEFGNKEDAIIYCERMGSYFNKLNIFDNL
jgi:hypothetical protein